MPTDTHIAVPPPGPELDAEVYTLLGHPKPAVENAGMLQWSSGPWGFHLMLQAWEIKESYRISTNPGAAFRALEMWRAQIPGRCWEARSATTEHGTVRGGDASVTLWAPMAGGGWDRADGKASSFPHAVALALLAALGGSK